MSGKSKLALVIQIVLGLLLIVAIVLYIGLHDISQVFFSINGIFLIYASIAYFIVNLLFSIRLKLVVKASRYKVSLRKVLPIQYGGMLASDFTPARSGYFVVPVMLTSENVPVTVGLSSILGIQSIEFLIKMVGGILAIVYLISMVNLSMDLFVLSVIGVTLMFIGAVIIFLVMWWKNAADLLKFFERFPAINRIVGFMTPKILKFQKEARNIRSVIMPILLLTILSWIFKG